MKYFAKKTLAVLLSVMMLLSVCGGVLSASAAYADCVTIYVRGSTDINKFNEDGTQQEIYDDGEYVSALIMEAVPMLPGAMITGNYENYANKVLEIMSPAYDAFRPSLVDGSVPANTRPDWYWNEETIRNCSNTYYEYCMDDRLSPFVVAEDLHNFIEAVKAYTGKSKINLYGRCLGPVAVATYLYLYERPNNYAGINGLMFSFSTHEGMAITNSIFTGNVVVSQQTLDAYLSNMNLENMGVDKPLADVLIELIAVISGSLGMKMTANVLNDLYIELKDVLFKPLLKEYYALCIMNLACINEKFDDMMSYLFSDEGDAEKYAYIIGELTRYHEEVYPMINTMLDEIRQQNKTMLIVADYGGQQYPLCEESEYLGDFQVGTKAQSLGATTAKLGETLSDAYIAEREAAGYGQYISPDKKVDASTCAFPDNTVFIANLDHSWPAKYAGIEMDWLVNGVQNAYSDLIPAQFMYWDYENEQVVALAAVVENEPEELSFFQKLINFFKYLFNLIVNAFK